MKTSRRELIQLHRRLDNHFGHAAEKPVSVAYTKRILSRHGVFPLSASYDDFQVET
jgi:hypothetical protein